MTKHIGKSQSATKNHKGQQQHTKRNGKSEITARLALAEKGRSGPMTRAPND